MRTVLILFLVLLIFPACKKGGDSCSQYQLTNIKSVRYMGTSASGIRGQDGAFFDVACTLGSSCYSINKMVESKTGNVVTIKAESVYNTCTTCPAMTVTLSKTYVFIPPDAGTYYLKWEGVPNRTDTVVIR
ncbi:hypothetical protein [Chitinophaga sp. RAB17]|uniref:hypothetical protein n=1 Tax=Chitinophaga sp. RAB17 TaxID=3233049 RepID=UPI003F91FA94